jgi:hypothetical protein
MKTPSCDIIDGAYRRVYQAYDQQKYGWYEYDPEHKTCSQEDVLFNYFINHPSSAHWARNGLKVLELCSPALIATVKRCLPFVDKSFDYDEDEDEDDDTVEYATPHLEVDARTLVAHVDVLQAELARLQEQAEELQRNPVNTEVKATTGPQRESSTDISVEYTEHQPFDTTLTKGVSELDKLLRCLHTEFAATKRRYTALLDKRAITYDLLWWLFWRGRVITFMDPNSDLLIAGQITSSSYKKDYRPYFNIQVRLSTTTEKRSITGLAASRLHLS